MYTSNGHIVLTSEEYEALVSSQRVESLGFRVKMGVGEGSGNLFVYGTHESIKACQATLLRAEQLQRELNEAQALIRSMLDYQKRHIEKLDTLLSRLGLTNRKESITRGD